MKAINKLLAVLLVIAIITVVMLYRATTGEYVYGYVYGQSIWFNFVSIFLVICAAAALILAVIVPFPDKFGNYGLAAKIIFAVLLVYFLYEPWRSLAILIIALRLVIAFLKALVRGIRNISFTGYTYTRGDEENKPTRRLTDAEKNPIDAAFNRDNYDVFGNRRFDR